MPNATRLGKREHRVRTYLIPAELVGRVATAHPEIREVDDAAADSALHEWMVTILYRDGRPIACPSRALEWLWLALKAEHGADRECSRTMLGRWSRQDERARTRLRQDVQFANVVAAWDRSLWSAEHQPVMFGLDEMFGLADGLSIDPEEARQLTRRAFDDFMAGRLARRRVFRRNVKTEHDPKAWLFPALYSGGRRRRLDLGQLPRGGFHGPGGVG